jgi:TRAP-type C4-dicarboxylate transport system substrate-binding protein
MKGFPRPARVVPAFLFLFAGVAAPLHAATYKIHWLLGHKNLDYFEEAAVSFKNAVEKGSNGDILVDITAQVSGEAGLTPALSNEIANKVAGGEAEMGHSFADVLGAIDPQMYAFDAPFLFRDYRHMEGVVEGPVGQEMLSGLRDHGVVGLSFTYSGGASGVATLGRDLRTPEDLKGLKVAVFGDAVSKAWLEDLGAKTVPFGHDLERLLPMTQEHAIDAVATTWRNFDRGGDLEKEYKTVGLMGSTYLVSVTYINPKFYDSLPQKYRDLITKASREAGRIERARTIQLNESAKRGMTEDKGIRVVNLTAANRRRFVAAVQPTYERSIEPLVGKALIEKIRKTADGPAFPSIPMTLVER